MTESFSVRGFSRTGAALLVCASVLIAVPAAEAACAGEPLPSGGRTLEAAGITRTFLVRTSAAYDGRTPAPLVITFHPLGMNAQYMQSRIPLARLWPDAIAVHAEAIGSGGSPAAWQSAPETERNRDLGYVDALLQWMADHACHDPARVFVLGYSNGAQFAGLLACARRDAIAGIAMAAGRLPCEPVRATPVILSHGLGDRTIAYSEATSAAGTWAWANGCMAPPDSRAPACAAAPSCSAAPLTLCTHAGGHEYDVSFTARAIAFFEQQHPTSR